MTQQIVKTIKNNENDKEMMETTKHILGNDTEMMKATKKNET